MLPTYVDKYRYQLTNGQTKSYTEKEEAEAVENGELSRATYLGFERVMVKAESSGITAIQMFPDRPKQKPGEFVKDYDSRLLRYLAECRSEHIPTFQRRAENAARDMGFRFIYTEVKDDCRTVVVSYPPEVDKGQLSIYMANVRNYFPLGTEVRAVAYPYR